MRARFVQEPEYTNVVSEIVGPSQQLEHIWGFSFQAEWIVPLGAEFDLIVEGNNDPENYKWAPLPGQTYTITETGCLLLNFPNATFSAVRYRVVPTVGEITSFKCNYYNKGI